MEENTIVITIKTAGEKCVMSDDELKNWYLENVKKLFTKQIGTPQIDVQVRYKLGGKIKSISMSTLVNK